MSTGTYDPKKERSEKSNKHCDDCDCTIIPCDCGCDCCEES